MLSSVFKCLKYLRLEGNPNYLQNKILLLLQVFPKFLGLKLIVLPRPCVIFISSKREPTHLLVTHTPALCAHTCLWCTHLPSVHTPALCAHTCPLCTHLPVVHTPACGAHNTLLPVVHTPARGAHTCLSRTQHKHTHACMWCTYLLV